MTIHTLSLDSVSTATATALGWTMVWNDTHKCVASYPAATTGRYFNSNFIHPAGNLEEAVAVATEGLKLEAAKQIHEAEGIFRLRQQQANEAEAFIARVRLASVVKSTGSVRTVRVRRFLLGLGNFWFEGEYDPGCPSSGFGGPPENYDPGEPDFVDLVRARGPEGKDYTYEEFEELLQTLPGMSGEEAQRTIDQIQEGLLQEFYQENPPTVNEDWDF